MATLRSAAITCGACPALTCERSYSKVTSLTQCSLFSTCQCSRMLCKDYFIARKGSGSQQGESMATIITMDEEA